METMSLVPVPATLEDLENLSDDPDVEDFVAAPQWESTAIVSNIQYQTPATVEVNENLWGSDDEQEVSKEELCSFHGLTCKKGICIERSKIERRKERMKEMEAKGENVNGDNNQNTRGKGKRRGRGGRGRGKGMIIFSPCILSIHVSLKLAGRDSDRGMDDNGTASNGNNSDNRRSPSVTGNNAPVDQNLEEVDPW
jgi:hypothetical protein